jgi:organic hydroperoxide reductase OsmC/OhrA
MQTYPHTYVAGAAAGASGAVTVESPGLARIPSAPPAQFGGPGDLWSPETLLCAALADCFVLTFRAVSRAARFEWSALDCKVEGILDRVEGTTRFVRYKTSAELRVAPGADVEKARQLLERAEKGCLIAASLLGERELVAQVRVEGAAA